MKISTASWDLLSYRRCSRSDGFGVTFHNHTPHPPLSLHFHLLSCKHQQWQLKRHPREELSGPLTAFSSKVCVQKPVTARPRIPPALFFMLTTNNDIYIM